MPSTSTSSCTAAALFCSAMRSSAVRLISMICSRPLRAELARHADVEAVDAVLAFEISGAGQNLLLVFQNCFGHLDRRGRRRVVSRAGLEQADDLRAAVGRALDDGVDLLFRQQLGDRECRRRSNSAAAAPSCRRGRRARRPSRSRPKRPAPRRGSSACAPSRARRPCR